MMSLTPEVLNRFVLRNFGRWFGSLIFCALTIALGIGWFVDLGRVPFLSAQHGLIAVSLAWWLSRVIGGEENTDVAWRLSIAQFQHGLVTLAICFSIVQIDGGSSSWVYPIVYVALAFLVGLNGRSIGLGLTVCAVGLQIIIDGVSVPEQGLATVGRCLFLVFFALAQSLFIQVEVMHRRRLHAKRLAEEIDSLHREAREYRLVGSALDSTDAVPRAMQEAKLARAAVESIHQTMFCVLTMLKETVNLQTCVLLWLDATSRRLRIRELVTDSDNIVEADLSADQGAIGGVIKNRILLNLRRSGKERHSLPYYQDSEDIGAFIAVPVLEGGHVRGVLCADRIGDEPFALRDEQLFVNASQQIVRSIQTERVLAAVERSKYEHQRFYRASAILNDALTLAQVYQRAIESAREITDFDFAAITLYDARRRRHTICRVWGAAAATYEGQAFADNAGFVAMAIKNRHFLPAGERWREKECTVFTKRLKLGRHKSLLVMPLIVQERAIGAMVLAAHAKNRFTKNIRDMLGVIGNQVAISIENAKMYKRMEEMATTDGLTRLPNHRTFQSRFDDMLNRAERHGKPVSLLLMDVDKFKSINDTYGHPVGDQVLQRVARILENAIRKVDLVARYGGEEFALVLEETDSSGAQLLSERVRQEVASQVMNSEKGAFRVTISLGIASYPRDGQEKQMLIDRADQALYAAKSSGRNRTVLFGNVHQQGKCRAAG